MNDYGLLAALKEALEQHPKLHRKIKGVYSYVPETTTPPYVVIELGSSQDGVDRSLVELALKVYSAYCGLREVQNLLRALLTILDGQEIIVLSPHEENIVSTALLWAEARDIELLKDNITRSGSLFIKALIRPLRR